MLALFGEPGVIDDRGLDRAERFDLWQRHLAHFAQHSLIGPRGDGDKMQQRLVFRSRGGWRGKGGHWLDALALAGQQQPGAVVVQRHHAIGMTDDAGQLLDVGLEPQAARVTLQEIHGCLTVRARISIVYEGSLIRRKLDFATQ
jgi:hypothetical protein